MFIFCTLLRFFPAAHVYDCRVCVLQCKRFKLHLTKRVWLSHQEYVACYHIYKTTLFQFSFIRCLVRFVHSNIIIITISSTLSTVTHSFYEQCACRNSIVNYLYLYLSFTLPLSLSFFPPSFFIGRQMHTPILYDILNVFVCGIAIGILHKMLRYETNSSSHYKHLLYVQYPFSIGLEMVFWWHEILCRYIGLNEIRCIFLHRVCLHTHSQTNDDFCNVST